MENKSWLCLAACLIFISSCGPTYKLRKAQRLINEAISQGASVIPDTTFVTKTVFVPPTQFEMVLKHVNFDDTITVEKEKIVTRVKVDVQTREVYVETECPPDTVKIKVPVTITKTIEAKQGFSLWQLIILAFVALLAGYGVRAFMRR